MVIYQNIILQHWHLDKEEQYDERHNESDDHRCCIANYKQCPDNPEDSSLWQKLRNFYGRKLHMDHMS